MKMLSRLTLAGAVAVLALGTQASAGTTTVYTVGVLGVPGVDTGLVLTTGMSVTVTATGSLCPGTGTCYGPDGTTSKDTTTSSYGGFTLPGAPAYGLLGQVGNGPWVQVGSGPMTLSGTGDLRFAVNDDYWPDNAGSFTITVTADTGTPSVGDCWPGNGYGDTNHSHTGPPPKNSTGCWPGNGYGDTNHDHTGPPGQSGKSSPSAGTNGSGGQQGNGHHGKP